MTNPRRRYLWKCNQCGATWGRVRSETPKKCAKCGSRSSMSYRGREEKP